jgi:hypothetical protein
LSKGYSKYLELLKSGEAKVKTTGLDVSEQVWTYFTSRIRLDQSIESKLVDLASKLKDSLEKTAGTALFSSLAQRFSLVLDISGSMMGTPIQTGLLYMLLMAKVFRIKELYYFESKLSIVHLSDADLDGTFCYLIHKIYKNATGSTELTKVFDYFRSNKIRDKNVIIITDGDCDPQTGSQSNPFHTAPKGECGMKYVVVNVKETRMNFPYLGMDPDVCYVSGNNPKTLNGLIKALVISMVENKPITPSLVLKCSLDLIELEHSFQVGTFSKVFTQEEISNLYGVFLRNLPPKSNNWATVRSSNDLESDTNVDSDLDSDYA